jgi:S1-C subfamily serine protease
VNSLTTQPHSPSKLLGRVRTKVAVAGASVVVLALGVVTAPRSEQAPALTTPDERTAPLLEAELARRQGLATFERVQDLGSRVIGYSVVFPAPAPAARLTRREHTRADLLPEGVGVGVVVASDGRVLTHVHALSGRESLSFDAVDRVPRDVELVAYDPDTGLVMLRAASPAGLNAAPLSMQRPPAGAMTAAAARGASLHIIAPVVIAGVSPRTYTLGGGESLPPGTPLYDQDGALLAVTAGGGVAYPAADAVARLNVLAATGRGQPAETGIVLQPLDPSLAPWFGDDGVVVSDIEPGSPAATAGVQPGDVLLAVNDDTVLDVTDAIVRLTAGPAGRALPLSLRRNGTATELALVPSPAFVRATSQRAADRDRPDGPRVSDLIRLAPGDLPLPPDARVLSVNLRPVASVQTARQVARNRRGALLYLQERDERYFVAVPGGLP